MIFTSRNISNQIGNNLNPNRISMTLPLNLNELPAQIANNCFTNAVQQWAGNGRTGGAALHGWSTGVARACHCRHLVSRGRHGVGTADSHLSTCRPGTVAKKAAEQAEHESLEPVYLRADRCSWWRGSPWWRWHVYGGAGRCAPVAGLARACRALQPGAQITRTSGPVSHNLADHTDITILFGFQS